MKNKLFLIILIIITSLLSVCKESDTEIKLEVKGLRKDCSYVPVHVRLNLPGKLKRLPDDKIHAELRVANTNETVPGQIVTDRNGNRELWWVIPELKAESVNEWIVRLDRRDDMGNEYFSWKDTPGKYLELMMKGKNLTRFMYAFDTTSEQRLQDTYKPFLHVYDENGKKFITEGPNGDEPFNQNRVLYPHHRGLFFGWPLECDGKPYSYWSFPMESKQVCEVTKDIPELVSGPVMGRCTALIHWNDENGTPLIIEERSMTVYRQNSSSLVLLDFESELASVKGNIILKGNANHGGLHFRAHNDVSIIGSWRYFTKRVMEQETAEDVMSRGGASPANFLFPYDSVAPYPKEPYEKTRSMILEKFKDLPWTAMTFRLHGNQYTIQHMNHPDNPSPSEYSAYRSYGRIGSYFGGAIPKGENLNVKYRIRISKGNIPAREDMNQKYTAFTESAEIEVR